MNPIYIEALANSVRTVLNSEKSQLDPAEKQQLTHALADLEKEPIIDESGKPSQETINGYIQLFIIIMELLKQGSS